jgi:hypothetical protein
MLLQQYTLSKATKSKSNSSPLFKILAALVTRKHRKTRGLHMVINREGNLKMLI